MAKLGSKNLRLVGQKVKQANKRKRVKDLKRKKGLENMSVKCSFFWLVKVNTQIAVQTGAFLT
jgi:hypothetical protein